jgi:hypothetical protein
LTTTPSFGARIPNKNPQKTRLLTQVRFSKNILDENAPSTKFRLPDGEPPKATNRRLKKVLDEKNVKH